MNEERKPYTMSARDLVTDNCEIVAHFHGEKTYVGPLSGLKAWAGVHEPGVLRRCVSNGMRHGLAPCIVAVNPRLSAALSVDYGQHVAVGDGRSFKTRQDLLDCKAFLERSGVPVPNYACVWAITNLPYGPADHNPKAPKPAQPELPLETTEEVNAMIFG